METNSKISVVCDSCKMPMARTKEEKVSNLQAQLANDFGEPKDYHFCSEDCLRNFLNARWTKKKKSKASCSFDPIQKAIIVDLINYL